MGKCLGIAKFCIAIGRNGSKNEGSLVARLDHTFSLVGARFQNLEKSVWDMDEWVKKLHGGLNEHASRLTEAIANTQGLRAMITHHTNENQTRMQKVGSSCNECPEFVRNFPQKWEVEVAKRQKDIEAMLVEFERFKAQICAQLVGGTSRPI